MSILSTVQTLDPITEATQKPLDTKTNLPTGVGNVLLNVEPFPYSDIPSSQKVLLPDSYSSYTPYLKNINVATDVDELRSNAQGWSGKVGNALLRSIPVTLAKIGQNAAAVGGFMYALPVTAWEKATGNTSPESSWSAIWDNAFIDAFSDAEEGLKEWAPIYKSNQYKHGGVLDKMLTPDYWTEDFADGVEFLASAWAGGWLTKPLQVGGGLLKATGFGRKILEAQTYLASGAKTAGKFATAGKSVMAQWDNIVVTAYNTIGEAGIEARDTYKTLMGQYEAGEWGKGLTPEEAKKAAGGRAAETFGFNTAILVAPNFIQSKWFGIGADKLTKQEIRSFIAGTAKTGGSKLLGNFLKGVAAEGLWEEGIQSALQNFEKRAYSNKSENVFEKIAGIASEYSKGFSRTDDQLSMLTGAIIGGGMGAIGTFVETSQRQAQFNKINLHLNISDALYNSNYQSLFERETVDVLDATGAAVLDDTGAPKKQNRIKLDSHGNPIYNYDNMLKLFQQLLIEDSLISESMAASLKGDALHKNVVETIALSRLASEYFDIDYGMDILEVKLEKLAKEKADGNPSSASEIMQALEKQKTYIHTMKSLWDKSKETKRIVSTDPLANDFDKTVQKAEFFQRLMMDITSKQRDKIISDYSEALADSSHPLYAEATEKLANTEAVLKDFETGLWELTANQDALFTDFKRVKAKKESRAADLVAVQEELDILDKEGAAIQADLTLSDDDRKTAMDAVEAKADVIFKREEAKFFSNTLEDAVQAELKVLNSTEIEAKRVDFSLTTKENIFYKLGLNAVAIDTIRDMIAKKESFANIMKALKDSSAIPSQALLEELALAIGQKEPAEALATLLASNESELQSLSNSIVASKLIDSLYTRYGSIDKAATRAKLMSEVKARTADKTQMLFLSLLLDDPTIKDEFNVLFDPDDIDDDILQADLEETLFRTKVDYNKIHTSTVEVEAAAIDLIEAVNNYLASGNASDRILIAIAYRKLVDKDLTLINEFFNLTNTNKDVFVNTIESIKTNTLLLADQLNDTNNKDLIKLLRTANTPEARIRNVILALQLEPSMQKDILDDYFVNEKIIETEAFLETINEDEYTDYDMVNEWLRFFSGGVTVLSGRSKAIFPETTAKLTDLVTKLKALRDKVLENQGNKMRAQNTAYGTMITKLLFVGDLKYDSKSQTFQRTITDSPLYKLIKDHATIEHLALFEAIVAKTKIVTTTPEVDETNILDASDYLIIEQVLSSIPTEKVNEVIENNAKSVTNVLIRDAGPSSEDTRGAFENAFVVNPFGYIAQVIATVATDIVNLRDNSSTSPAVKFSKHRDPKKLLEDIRNWAPVVALPDAQRAVLLDKLSKIIGLLAIQDTLIRTVGIGRINVLERHQKEAELLAAAEAGAGLIPTVEQLIAVRQLYGRIKTGTKRTDGASYMMLTNGTLGTGKTEIVPKWLMKMLGYVSTEVVAFGHNANTSKQVATKLGTTETSIEEFLSKDISADTKLIVVDEIHTLTRKQLSDLVNKLEAINKGRTEKVYLLGLGDPYQITSAVVSPIYGFNETGGAIMNNYKYANVFETTPLTVRYRSSVLSINNFVDKFYGTSKTIGRVVGTISSNGKFGVNKLSDAKAVINSIQTNDSARSVAIVVSNDRDKQAYADLLKSAGIEYFDMQDSTKNKMTGQKVQLYNYADIGGITVDRVYVQINTSDFTGSYTYNTAMYTALGRATQLITVVNMDNVVSQVSDAGTSSDIDNDIEGIKNLMEIVKQIEDRQIAKLHPGVASTPIAKPPVEEAKPEEVKVDEPKPEDDGTEPPSSTPPEAEKKKEEEFDEDEDSDVFYEVDDEDDDGGSISGPTSVDTSDDDFVLLYPTMAQLKRHEVGDNVIIAINEGQVVVFAERFTSEGKTWYSKIAVLSDAEITALQDEGKLPPNIDAKGTHFGDNPDNAYYVLNNDAILATAKLSGLQLLRFNYSQVKVADGSEIAEQLNKAAADLGIENPSIQYRIFRNSGTDSSVDKLNLKFAGTGFTLKAGFPYAVIRDKNNSNTVFYVRLKARKMSKDNDPAFFTAIEQMITAIENITNGLQSKAKEVRLEGNTKAILNSITLGDYIFNTILNRTKDLITISENGTLSFNKTKTKIEENIKASIEYLINGGKVVRGTGTMSVMEAYLLNNHASIVKDLTPEERRKLAVKIATHLKAKFVGVFNDNIASVEKIVTGYYGTEYQHSKFNVPIQKESGANKTDDEIKTELDTQLVKIKAELKIKYPKLNVEHLTYVEHTSTASSKTYFLTDVAGQKVKDYTLRAGKGSFQAHLNRVAKANTRVLGFDFTVEIKTKKETARMAKGFLAMTTDRAMTLSAGQIRLFYWKIGGITPADDINIDNIAEQIKEVKRLYDIFKGVDGFTMLQSMRNIIDEERLSKGLAKLSELTAQKFQKKLDAMESIIEKLDSDKADDSDAGHVTLDNLRKFTEVDDNGIHPHLRAQLPISEFNQKADDKDTAYLNSNLESHFEGVSTTIAKLNNIEKKEAEKTKRVAKFRAPKLTVKPPPIKKEKEEEEEETLLSKDSDTNLGASISFDEAFKIARKLLPGITEKELLFLEEVRSSKGEAAFGRMINGVIELERYGKTVKTNVLYHEIFHVIWNYYLTADERKRMSKMYTSKYGYVSDVEERMARDFQVWRQKKTGVSWLQNIFERILAFFGLVNRHHNSIEDLFNSIHNGIYTKKVSAEDSLSRNMLSLMEDFDNDTTTYNIANNVLTNLLSSFTDPTKVEIPLPSMEAAIKIYSIITGKEKFGSVPNYPVLVKISKFYTSLDESNIEQVLTDLNSNLNDVLNGTLVVNNDLFKSLQLRTAEAQHEFIKILVTSKNSLFKLNDTITLKSKNAVKSLPLVRVEYANLVTAFKKLSNERVFFDMVSDLDKSSKFKGSRRLFSAIAEGMEEDIPSAEIIDIQDSEEDAEQLDLSDIAASLDEAIEKEAAFMKLKEQIIDNDRVDREKSLSVKVKMFLGRQYIQKTDANGKPLVDKKGNPIYELDAYGYKKPLNKSWAYAILLNIMSKVQLEHIPKRQELTKWLKDEISKATNKTTRSHVVDTLMYSLYKLIDIAYSQSMSSGKQFLGNFRFTDENTFVYTEDFYDIFYNTAGRKRTLYREFHDRADGAMTSVELATNPKFKVIKIKSGETHTDFVNRVVGILAAKNQLAITSADGTNIVDIVAMPTINISNSNTPNFVPLIELHENSSKQIVPKIFSNVNEEYVSMLSDDDVAELNKFIENELPRLVNTKVTEIYDNNPADVLIVNGKEYDGNKSEDNESLYNELSDEIGLSLLNEKIIQMLVTQNYRIAYAADLFANITTNFVNQHKQNFHFVVQETKNGKMSTRLGTSSALNVTQSYRADVKVMLIKHIEGLLADSPNATVLDKLKFFEKEVERILNTTDSNYLATISAEDKKELTKILRAELTVERLPSIKVARILQLVGLISKQNPFELQFGETEAGKVLRDIDGFISRTKSLIATPELDEEVTDTDVEDVLNASLNDSSGLLSSITSIITAYQDKQTNPSIVSPDGKKRFMYSQGSWGHSLYSDLTSRRSAYFRSKERLLQAVKQANTAALKAGEGVFIETIDTNITLNPLVEDVLWSYEYIIHDGFRLSDTFVVSYADEDAMTWTKRQINANFFGSIGIKDTQLSYVQPIWTISNKKMTAGVKLRIKDTNELKENIKLILQQFLNRDADLSAYVQHFRRDKYTNFDILNSLLEKDNANALKFDAAINNNQTNVDATLLDSLADDLILEIGDITKVLVEELKDNPIQLNSNLIALYKLFITKKLIHTSLTVEEQATLSDTNFFTKDGNGDYQYAFKNDTAQNKIYDTVFKELMSLFVTNQYVQGYSLNQLAIGDFAFAKNAFDVIKRMSGVFGMGAAPGFLLSTGLTFDMLIGTDINTAVTDELFKNSKVAGTLANISDAAGYMLPERREQLSKGLSSEYNLGYVTKPAHFEVIPVQVPVFITGENGEQVQKYERGLPVVKIVNVPVMLKMSVISLEDDICLININKGDVPTNWTPHGVLRYNMRRLKVQEYVANSGVKFGAPSKAYLADTVKLFTDPEYYKTLEPFRSLHTRTLSNAAYRMQFNPDSQNLEQNVTSPAQLPFFLNILAENAAQSKEVYTAMAYLMRKGREKVEALEQEGKLESQVTKSISSPDALRLKDMLNKGISTENPAVVVKFINYLSSFISKKSVEIKFPGNKLVLMSAFGFSYLERSRDFAKTTLTRDVAKYAEAAGRTEQQKLDDLMNGLKYVEEKYIDDKGVEQIRTYAEVLVPQAWASFVKLGDFMYGDGLAYRVPTSELHSAIPIKIVGFLTTKRTNLIVVPKELVHLHGSDFDVDSLFVIRRETYGSLYGKTGFDYIKDIQEEARNFQSKAAKIAGKLDKLQEALYKVYKDEAKQKPLDAFLERLNTLSTDIAQLHALAAIRSEEFKTAYQGDDYDYTAIEKEFNDFLKSNGSAFIDWIGKEKKTPGTKLIIKPAEKGQATVLDKIQEKLKDGDTFNMHRLRFSFGTIYSNNTGKQLRWKAEREDWSDTGQVHSSTVKALNNEVKDKNGKIIKHKGEIFIKNENYGRWYPFVAKTKELLDIEEKVTSNKLNINELNNLLPDVLDAINIPDGVSQVEAVSALRKLVRAQAKELLQEQTDLISELKDIRSESTPVGYEYKKIRILNPDGTIKIVNRWVLDPNFIRKVKGMPLGAKQKQKLIEKYYKNTIVENMLEIVTAPRNRKRMFSPIQLSKFNAEDNDTDETGLFAQGSVFRYLQDTLLNDPEYAEKADTSDRAKRNIISLRKVADMSNFINHREAFLSNFEGLSLTGVFANSMKAIAYTVKSGYTFYGAGEIKKTQIKVSSLKAKHKTTGNENPTVKKLQEKAAEVAKQKLELNTIDRASPDFHNQFLEKLNALLAAEKIFSDAKKSLQEGLKDTLDTDVLEAIEMFIEVDTFVGSGEESYIEPFVKTDNDFILLNGVSYNKIVDKTENWELLDALLNAAVDNVKEQILPVINGTGLTANALALAVIMDIDINTLALLLNQPAIKYLSTFQYGDNDSRIRSTLAEIEVKLAAKDPTYDTTIIRNLTEEDLKTGFVLQHKGVKLDELTIEQLKVQHQVLLQYRNLSKTGEDMFTLSRALSVLKDLPVFVDDIMNNIDDWNKIGSFDADYNFTPNPAFTIMMGNWLERLPHIVEAVKARDFLYNKVRQMYVHSEEFADKVDAITYMPDLSEGNGSNRNKVKRRFEMMKFISSSIYDTSNEPEWKFTGTTAKGKAVPKKYVGAKAFSQRFLYDLYLIKSWVRNNKLELNPKLEMFLDSLEVNKNRWGDYYVRFVGNVNSDYAKTLDLETGFRELNNVIITEEGENVVKALKVVDGVVSLVDKDIEFTSLQEDFLKFAAINYGLAVGVTNYTSVIPMELLTRVDDMLRAKVQELQTPVTLEDEKITATVFDNIVDLFQIGLVANFSTFLNYVVGKTVRNSSGVAYKINASFTQQGDAYTGVTNVYSGYENNVFYDLKLNNITSNLITEPKEYEAKLNATYPRFIRFGSYNTAYYRVEATPTHVYYKQVGSNPTQIYDLNPTFISNPYYLEDYFNPRVLTVIASEVTVFDTGIVRADFYRETPKWLVDFIAANPTKQFYMTSTTDTDKRNRVRVKNARIVNGNIVAEFVAEPKSNTKTSPLVVQSLDAGVTPIINAVSKSEMNSTAKGVVSRNIKTPSDIRTNTELNPAQFGSITIDLSKFNVDLEKLEAVPNITIVNNTIHVLQNGTESALEIAAKILISITPGRMNQEKRNSIVKELITSKLDEKSREESIDTVMRNMSEPRVFDKVTKVQDPSGFWTAYANFIKTKLEQKYEKIIVASGNLNEVKRNGTTIYLNLAVPTTTKDEAGKSVSIDNNTVINTLSANLTAITAIAKANPGITYAIPVEIFNTITLNRMALPFIKKFIQTAPNIKLFLNTTDKQIYRNVVQILKEDGLSPDNPLLKTCNTP